MPMHQTNNISTDFNHKNPQNTIIESNNHRCFELLSIKKQKQSNRWIQLDNTINNLNQEITSTIVYVLELGVKLYQQLILLFVTVFL